MSFLAVQHLKFLEAWFAHRNGGWRTICYNMLRHEIGRLFRKSQERHSQGDPVIRKWGR